MQKVTGGFVGISCIVYIVQFKVHPGAIVTNDHLVLDTIVSQVVKSFPEVADLVQFIVGILHESNLDFLVGG